MVPRGKVVLWTVFMCLSCSTATWPAFLVQVRTRGHHVGTGTVASHGIQYRARRKAGTPLFSATEKADTTQEVRWRSWCLVGAARPSRPSHEQRTSTTLLLRRPKSVPVYLRNILGYIHRILAHKDMAPTLWYLVHKYKKQQSWSRLDFVFERGCFLDYSSFKITTLDFPILL